MNPDNILDKVEKNISFTDAEIFTNIWTKPRDVFKYINDNSYDKFVKTLLIFAGISRALERATIRNMGDEFPLFVILGICIIFGGLLGWISFYIFSALISWTGKWLNGKGNTDSILRIISYAMIPSIIGLFFLIPQIAIYGNEIFKADGDITSGNLITNIIFYGSLFLEFFLSIWTIVLCVIGISEVQKLGIGKSLINIILSVLTILVPLLILGGLIGFLLNG